MFDKIIFHIDVNSAFLSWEAVHRIEHRKGNRDLREFPSAVGGDISKRHGIILAKSISAKGFGIKTGDSIPEALQKCPKLYLAPPNYGLYERCSRAFMEILREYSACVEQYSIDEAYVDMTETVALWGGAVETAERMREQIYRELGFTVNIGISENKLLAKMASDFEKPNKVHTLFREEIPRKMWGLPVSDLFFVGRATAKKLRNLGIRTIGELANGDPEILRAHLKKHGEVIWAFANGMDVSAVESEPIPNKGYGNSTTVAFDVTDASTARLVLLGLAETVGSRMRRDKMKAEVVSVGIKYDDFTQLSHQRVLEEPTNITMELAQRAGQLFEEAWNGKPIRHLGVHAGRVVDQDVSRQLKLFDNTDYEKLEMMDRTVDQIRRRFGIDAVKRASFVQSPIDHLSGGISREKRTVDYERLGM